MFEPETVIFAGPDDPEGKTLQEARQYIEDYGYTAEQVKIGRKDVQIRVIWR